MLAFAVPGNAESRPIFCCTLRRRDFWFVAKDEFLPAKYCHARRMRRDAADAIVFTAINVSTAARRRRYSPAGCRRITPNTIAKLIRSISLIC